MKKIGAKLSIALVCALLGFMITYQLKSIYNQSNKVDVQQQSAEIILENEQLEKQKEELQGRIDELQNKIKQYEESTASRDERSNLLLKELEEMRLLNGASIVEGEGIVMYITPKSNIFGNAFEGQPVNDIDLVTIVNELNAADAEAISINDIRITSQTGIRNAGNSILINDTRISYNKQIVIKAIGNKELLETALNFPGNIPDLLYQFCDIEHKAVNKIIIPKSNDIIKFEYAKPVDR